MKVVLDASAALAAVLGHKSQGAVLDALAEASAVIAPDLIASEVANGLWKYVMARQLDLDDALDLLASALQLVDRSVQTSELANEALREAAARRHPVYDLCYAVLARREGAAVVTIDAKLRKLLSAMRVPTLPA